GHLYPYPLNVADTAGSFHYILRGRHDRAVVPTEGKHEVALESLCGADEIPRLVRHQRKRFLDEYVRARLHCGRGVLVMVRSRARDDYKIKVQIQQVLVISARVVESESTSHALECGFVTTI